MARGVKGSSTTSAAKKAAARSRAYRAVNSDHIKAIKKAWYAINSEYKKAAQKAWRAKNPSKVKAANRAWNTAHSMQAKAASKAWRIAHPAKANAASKVWKVANSVKVNAVNKAWYNANSERAKAARKAWKAAYPGENNRLSKLWYERQLVKRAGCEKPRRCNVCKRSGVAIHFDHDHEDGHFRGWPCFSCNWALGHAKDSAKLLRKLATYLEQPLKYHVVYKGSGYMKKADRALVGPRPDKCQVCKQAGKICIDHCHRRNLFRGWLCHNCNCILGCVRDSAKILHKLADYLDADKLKQKELKKNAKTKSK